MILARGVFFRVFPLEKHSVNLVVVRTHKFLRKVWLSIDKDGPIFLIGYKNLGFIEIEKTLRKNRYWKYRSHRGTESLIGEPMITLLSRSSTFINIFSHKEFKSGYLGGSVQESQIFRRSSSKFNIKKKITFRPFRHKSKITLDLL